MPVVGTAGHVDHGKSTLIKAITGRDPDRWEEEKRRGLTIDLGFAWTTLNDGTEVGFVDVPGHERFIKNMLAGIDAIDVALFVVAADEGWMPQSEEHLAVLDLLGITRGVIALTRVDAIDVDGADLAELEVRERVAGTCLDGAPIIRTAAPSGVGVAEVGAALARALAGEAPAESRRTRMWIDRAFTIGGAGTVVTGTLVGGTVEVGDQLLVWPSTTRVRVRGIQSHERPKERLEPGNRAALNLAGITRDRAPRGSMLGRPGDWEPTDRFMADLRTVRSLADPLRDRGAFQLHVGSGAIPARLRLVDEPALVGRGVATVESQRPVPLKVGDRFILREVGRRAVVAGGVVLDPDPPRSASALRSAIGVLRPGLTDPDAAAQALLEVRGRAALGTLEAHSGGGKPRKALVAGDEALSIETAAAIGESAAQHVARFHRSSPFRPGMPMASLAEQVGLDLTVLEVLIDGHASLIREGITVRSSGFEPGFDEEADQAWEAARSTLAEAAIAVPRRSELALDREVLHALIRSGELVEIGPEFVYLPEQVEQVVEATGNLPDGFTVAEFRDALGITRKHAVPLLEWLDRAGITRRVGDGRTVRRPPSDAPDAGGVRSP